MNEIAYNLCSPSLNREGKLTFWIKASNSGDLEIQNDNGPITYSFQGIKLPIKVKINSPNVWEFKEIYSVKKLNKDSSHE
jgi:hypothetical protein